AARGRALLEDHSDLIQRNLHLLSSQSGLPAHEAKELCSWAMSKLVEDDYGVLASWQRRSSFATYLSVVLVNLVRDYLSGITSNGGLTSRVEERERTGTTVPLQAVLTPLLRHLTAEDRLLLKLHYREGFSMAAISRLMGTSVRELKTARSRCLKRLRRSFEEAGLDAGRVEALIGGAFGALQSAEGVDLWT